MSGFPVSDFERATGTINMFVFRRGVLILQSRHESILTTTLFIMEPSQSSPRKHMYFIAWVYDKPHNPHVGTSDQKKTNGVYSEIPS
jgi:hypothetical protein